MESVVNTTTWKALQKHKLDVAKIHMSDLFAYDSRRFERFSAQDAGFLLDYSKNRMTQETILLLLRLTEESGLRDRMSDMVSGKKINITEHRAVLHTELRNMNKAPDEVKNTWRWMERISDTIRKGRWLGFSGKSINHIVNIGIGGSDLGPKMVVHALKKHLHPGLTYDFVSTIDASAMSEVLSRCSPERTLFIVSSKSFTTTETLANAKVAKNWLLANAESIEALSYHFIAVTANREKAIAWGFQEENVLSMWDWVGGRYSLWSSIGFPIVVLCGMTVFEELLTGAYEMDQHFLNTDFSSNLPVLLALTGIWNHNFFHLPANVVLPYCEALRYFPDHLQQLEMESNGKSMDLSGQEILEYQTAPIIFGGLGTDSQHSFFQLLHQGTSKSWCDFIIPIKPLDELADHHAVLMANCFAQSQALMQGKSATQICDELIESGMSDDEAVFLAQHKMSAGNRPSNTILFPRVSPYFLGGLIALYEHKVFTQGVIWQINSFDQWGVELGKSLAAQLLPAIKGEVVLPVDSSTAGLMRFARSLEF